MKLAVSVVIPTYNSANFIRDSLQSIFAQTQLPNEILIVDDKSSDQTLSVVEQLRKEAPCELRVIELRQNSGGPVTPMNAGVEAARSEYIAMLDHDDRMLPDRLSEALPCLEDNENVGIVFNQFDFFDETCSSFMLAERRYDYLGSAAHTIPAKEAFRSLILQGFPYGGAGGMLFRKTAWKQVGGFRTQFRIVWDYDFGLRTASRGWDVFYLPRILFQHRRHANNLEAVDGGQRNSLEHFELLNELVQQRDLDVQLVQHLQQKLEKYIFRLADTEVLRKNNRLAAAYYWQALQKGLQPARAMRGFLRLPYRFLRNSLGLSNKGDSIAEATDC